MQGRWSNGSSGEGVSSLSRHGYPCKVRLYGIGHNGPMVGSPRGVGHRVGMVWYQEATCYHRYFTSHSYGPVRDIARSQRTSAATGIIYGLALG